MNGNIKELPYDNIEKSTSSTQKTHLTTLQERMV